MYGVEALVERPDNVLIAFTAAHHCAVSRTRHQHKVIAQASTIPPAPVHAISAGCLRTRE